MMLNIYNFGIFLCIFNNFSLALSNYADSKVLELKGQDFESKVRNNGISLVEFTTDYCKKCNDFSKVYKNLAEVFKDLVSVISVNDKELSKKYQVKTYPSVKLFFSTDSDPRVVEFSGDRDFDSLVSFTVKNFEKLVDERVLRFAPKSKEKPKVVQLTNDNFKSIVIDDVYGQWLVKFYAPWCGHCKNLEPEWMSLPQKSKGVKVGRVDCTANEQLCVEYKIRGYPTILLFNKGEKSVLKAMNYQGQRRAKDILDFAKKNDKRLSPPTHASSVSVLKEKCSGPICLLFFLPRDSRDQHLKTLESLALESVPFELTYSFGIKYVNHFLVGDRQQWERVFGLVEFPAVVGLNLAKGIFLPLQSEFSKVCKPITSVYRTL